MKKILLFIISIVITGCYNYTEINNIKLVSGIYIDYKNDKYILKFDIGKTISSEGKTISEAFMSFEEILSKTPYYAHVKIIIISSTVLKNHFDSTLKYFLRNPDFRNNFYIMVSDDIEKLNSSFIKGKIKKSTDVVKSCLFKNILINHLDDKEIILPVINNKKITGSVIKNKNKITNLNINETKILKIIKDRNPNIIYKNINIYESKVKYHKKTIDIYLSAELKEIKSKNKIKKSLESETKKLLNKIYKDKYNNVFIKLNINRKGQIFDE